MNALIALFHAVRNGDREVVVTTLGERPEFLHARNPNAGKENSQEWDEFGLLHTAAKFGHLAIVRDLVERGIEVYSNPMSTYPAVMLAAWEGHDDVVSYFLNEIPDKAEGTNGIGIACNLAARQGWMDKVRLHIERDPLAVHQRGWIGDTPLHWPAHNGFHEIVELLLASGADPNAHVLHWTGGTPLHWASEREPEIVKRLVQAGADVDARVGLAGSAMLGATPLIWCAKQRDDCAEAAQMLLSLGADPSLLDAEGKSALDWAREKGSSRIEAVLTG